MATFDNSKGKWMARVMVKGKSKKKFYKPTNDNYQNFLRWSTDGKGRRFKCPHCESTFSFKNNLKTHAKHYHTELFENTDFSKVEVGVIDEKKQSNQVQNDKTKFQCPFCDCNYCNSRQQKRYEIHPVQPRFILYCGCLTVQGVDHVAGDPELGHQPLWHPPHSPQRGQPLGQGGQQRKKHNPSLQ